MTQSSKSSRVVSRWLTFVAVAFGLAGGTTSCQKPADWNSAFRRTDGWLYADGGSSAALANGKRIWLFGDSWLNHDDGLLYNTIAIQSSDTGAAPRPGDLRFLARGAGGQALDVSARSFDGMRPWVESKTGASFAKKTWLWPTDAISVGGQLVAFYSEIECVRGEFPACRGHVPNWGFAGHSVMIVENPTEEPEKWRSRTTSLNDGRGEWPSAHRLHWGSALVDEGGWLYVFGTSLNDRHESQDVKLARVTLDDVERYAAWQFLTPHGFRMFPTGPTPGELQSVARGGTTEFSVQKTVHGGETAFVMVHVDPDAQDVVVRSTLATDLESARWAGPEAGPEVRRFSIPALDPASAGGRNWAGRAQRRRSAASENLFISYFSTSAASLRFVEIPLASIRAGD